MYVCVCRSVTDSQIKEAVCNGSASTMRCLKQQLGVASQCGCCARTAKDLLREHKGNDNLNQAQQ